MAGKENHTITLQNVFLPTSMAKIIDEEGNRE